MRTTRWIGAAAMFVWVAFAAAQDRGSWRAVSKTAQAITGDIAFGNDKLAINLLAFPIAQIRDLQPAELSALFEATDTATGRGNLYRVSIPGAKAFLHKNTLCGGEDTQWVATYAAGKRLQLAFFSGTQMPVITTEALANTTILCGTYTYER